MRPPRGDTFQMSLLYYERRVNERIKTVKLKKKCFQCIWTQCALNAIIKKHNKFTTFFPSIFP